MDKKQWIKDLDEAGLPNDTIILLRMVELLEEQSRMIGRILSDIHEVKNEIREIRRSGKRFKYL